MNKVILIGNITKDLELRKTQTNKSVVKFSLAINDGYGEKKVTDYPTIVAWEKLAETIVQYCSKGHKVMVEGKFKTDSYEKDGKKVYDNYVLASNIEFLQPREEKPEASPEIRQAQTTLTGDGRDLLGHYDKDIQPDELPFY